MNFMGKDAFTVTTMVIFLMFAVIALDFITRIGVSRLEPRFAFICPILIVLGLTISLATNRYFIMQSLRHYVENISGILLYFVMLSAIKKNSDSIRIIKVMLVALMLQSAISFLQLKFPDIASYFAFFGTRTFTPGALIVGGFTRATGTIWDFELLAQWFLIGSILSLFVIYEENKFTYSFFLFGCVVGIFFTKTRSDIILLVFTLVLIFISLILFKKGRKSNLIKLILITLAVGVLVIYSFPKQADEFSRRLETFIYSQKLISADAINREEVWDFALDSLKKPTFFGRGLYSIESLVFSSAVSFHSLYLTLIYQVGAFGMAIYAIFWSKILHRSWLTLLKRRECENWFTLFFLLICLVLILIDGIKIEYLRYGHTIQFAWMIYALIVIALRQSKETHEDTLVSKAAV
jgi:hypothetical protein